MLVYEPKFEDFLGRQYGSLTVKALLAREYKDGHVAKVPDNTYPEPIKYLCECDCGKLVVVSRNHLRDGITKSCGCIKHGRPKGKKTNNYNIPQVGRGCGKAEVHCNKMRGNCCWDCDDYEKCTFPCNKSPARCGGYRG